MTIAAASERKSTKNLEWYFAHDDVVRSTTHTSDFLGDFKVFFLFSSWRYHHLAD